MDSKEQFEKYKSLGLLLVVLLLLLDVYFNYYAEFIALKLTHPIAHSIIKNIIKTGLLSHPVYVKIGILLFSVFFVLLDNGKKTIEMDKRTAMQYVVVSSILFLSTSLLVYMISNVYLYIFFILLTYSFVIISYTTLHRILDKGIMNDRYNLQNKIFPQTTDLITNDMSINIPYRFVKELKSKKINGEIELTPIWEDGYINFVAPERSTIILGKPGSGKSYSFNEEFIRQSIKKGFSMINYDYKFPTLTNIAYNYFNTYKDSYDKYENKGRFGVINLDDPRYSDRCNPIHKNLLERKSQAIDAVYTIFFNLDKKSAQKQDFFQMSAMAITSAALWFLKTYKDGKYCSFPHLIELIQQPDEKLLNILDNYPDLRYFTSAFTDALQKESFEQLSGQTASARIPLGKCATDEMFWVMTDPDDEGINLRVNLPEQVTVLNIANDPETQKTNAPALGLYMSQSAKLINAHKRVPCCYHVDELPTIFVNGLNNLIATARSNKVCVVLSAQDYTQLVQEYGREIADTIFNTIDNIVTGKVAIDTAEKISKAIGKINYQTQSITINNDSTSMSLNTQRDFIVPPEDISQLSQGEFVGIVSDNFTQKIKNKAFRGEVAPSKKDLGNLEYPMKYPNITEKDLKDNVLQIQSDINKLVEEEMDRINDDKYLQQKEILNKNHEKVIEELGPADRDNMYSERNDDEIPDETFEEREPYGNHEEINNENNEENEEIVSKNMDVRRFIKDIKNIELD